MFSVKNKFFLSVFLVAVIFFQAPVSASDVSVTGSGWGDGVGLSQYGAKAMADKGFTHGGTFFFIFYTICFFVSKWSIRHN